MAFKKPQMTSIEKMGMVSKAKGVMAKTKSALMASKPGVGKLDTQLMQNGSRSNIGLTAAKTHKTTAGFKMAKKPAGKGMHPVIRNGQKLPGGSIKATLMGRIPGKGGY